MIGHDTPRGYRHKSGLRRGGCRWRLAFTCALLGEREKAVPCDIWVCGLIDEAVGIAVAQRIKSLSVDDGRAPPAMAAQPAASTSRRAGAISSCRRAVVDRLKSRCSDIAQQRRILAAGMNFAVGQQGDEIERRSAAKSRATRETAAARLLPRRC